MTISQPARDRPRRPQQNGAVTTPFHPATDCTAGPTSVPAGCRRISFGYSTKGYLACAFDPLGLLGRLTTDNLGRPTSITNPTGSSAGAAVNRTVSITYETNGTTKVSVPVGSGTTNVLHTFRIDRGARTMEHEAPALGGAEPPTKPWVQLGLDRQPEQLVQSEPWATVSIGYDTAYMRPQWRTFGSSDGGAGFFSDGATFEPDGRPYFVGRLRDSGWQAYYFHTFDASVPTQTSATYVASSGAELTANVARTFDDRLRLSTESVTLGGATSIATYGYSADGLISTASLGGSTLSTDRLLDDGVSPRPDGAPSKVSVGGTIETFRRSSFGEVTGSRDGSGNVTTWGSDATRSGTRYLAFTYDRDARGRITRVTETVAATPSMPARTQTTSYTYRHEGALERVVVRADVNGAVLADRSYSYDFNGNRDVPANAYDAQDRIISAPYEAFTHDHDGRLVTNYWGTFYNNFDADGQLTRYTWLDSWTWTPKAVRYRYDAFGRRVQREQDGVPGVTSYIYEDGGLLPIAEYRDGAVVSRFVFASRRNVPDFVLQNGRIYRIFADHLGSPRVVVDTTNGAVVQRTDYDEWGVVTGEYVASGFTAIPFGFAGGLYDRTTKYLHFGAREYNPARGRWLTKDALGFAAGYTNFYAYCYNDPVNWIDVDGKVPLFVVTAFGGGVLNGGANALLQLVAMEDARAHGRKAEFDWISFATSTAAGAVQGALLPGMGASRFGAGVLGYVTGAFQSIVNDVAHGECDVGKIVNNQFKSGVAGGLGGIAAGPVTFPSVLRGGVVGPYSVAEVVGANFTGKGLLFGATGAYLGGITLW